MRAQLGYNDLKKHRLDRGRPFFEGRWDLNLFVARDETVGIWGRDRLLIACKDDSDNRVVRRYPVAGDAWEGEWTDSTHPDGCIFTLDGHYPGALTIGTHRDRPALIQVAKTWNVRWPPGMGRKPTVQELRDLGLTDKFYENRGCNVHNRVSDSSPDQPDANSTEGCTLIRYQMDHKSVMECVDLQRRWRGTSTVSPTYCSLRDF